MWMKHDGKWHLLRRIGSCPLLLLLYQQLFAFILDNYRVGFSFYCFFSMNAVILLPSHASCSTLSVLSLGALMFGCHDVHADVLLATNVAVDKRCNLNCDVFGEGLQRQSST